MKKKTVYEATNFDRGWQNLEEARAIARTISDIDVNREIDHASLGWLMGMIEDKINVALDALEKVSNEKKAA